MAEYIDREATKRAFQNFDAGRKEGSTLLTPDEFAEYLDEFPAADVVPVVHGKWIESANFDTGFWVCSKCRFVSEAIAAHKLYGYCPNCGAKMDGGADNE